MKIFIYLPNWLGDAVMAAAAINNILRAFSKAKFTFYGSFVACKLYENLGECIIEDKKNRKAQIAALDEFDLAICFKASIGSKFLMRKIRAKKKLCFWAQKSLQIHQVSKYKNLLKSLKIADFDDKRLPIKRLKTRKLIGIAAGANYGAAKCYEPKYFAQIAANFSEHRILIFGTASESEICKTIEQELKKMHKNVVNLCGKTSIKKLVMAVSSLEYLLANDSGIMHIGASFDVKTLAFFGPTNYAQTSPYSKNAQIFTLDLDCSPCMKRICPKKHHDCMKKMKPEFILDKLR